MDAARRRSRRIIALKAQLAQRSTKRENKKGSRNRDGKNKKANLGEWTWKDIPPKDGEAKTKQVKVKGKTKTYHWCRHHNQWTVHKPNECNLATPED